jgi:hypothetical protein
VQGSDTKCSTVRHSAGIVIHNAVHWDTVQPVQYMRHNAVQLGTAQYTSETECSAVKHTLRYSETQYSTERHSAMQCDTVHCKSRHGRYQQSLCSTLVNTARTRWDIGKSDQDSDRKYKTETGCPRQRQDG